MAELPYAHGGPLGAARLRVEPGDFRVDEVLGFEPAGEGPHAWLLVEKIGLTTDQLVRDLARTLDIDKRDIGLAGLKDRHAVTRQWLSLPWPEAEPLPADCHGEDWCVVRASRNQRKLKRGQHQANRFLLTLREIDAAAPELHRRLMRIALRGVPNYFGEQRFGRDGDNVAQAMAWLRGERRKIARHLKGIYLSSLRSWLFNRVLAARVARGDWDRVLPGELCNLDGSQSVFLAESVDDAITRRLALGDIHPTGPLPGEPGKLLPTAEVIDLENGLLAEHGEMIAGLCAKRVQAERRALRVCPRELAWRFTSAGTLEVSFQLPSGAFATTVLRELCATTDVQRSQR